MRLTEVGVKTADGRVRLSGQLETAEGRRLPEVWFEYPETYADFVRAEADAFLPIMLMGAMLDGEKLETELPVSQRLARELPVIEAILAAWFPDDMTPVELSLSNVVAKPPNGSAATGAFFSAGVDAFHTVMADKEGRRRDYARITHLVHMTGLEAPLSRTAGDKEERIAAIAGELGLPVIIGRTNVRDVFEYEYLPFVCGPALAAVALSLSGGLSAVRIPSGTTLRCRDLYPESTHPFLDHHWSTEYVDIRQDGCEITRCEKIEFLARYPFVLENLSVCIRNLGAFANCGRCPKCVRTMVSLQAIGALDKTPTLPSPFDYTLIRALELKDYVELCFAGDNLELARRTGRDRRLVKALERHIRRHEKYRALVELVADTPLHPPMRWLRQFVKDRFAKGGGA